MKHILLVDIDGTLTKETCYTEADVLKATPIQETIDHINRLYGEDFIIMYTARRDNLISATLTWLKRNGIQFHAISNIKIPGDAYIDEIAVHPSKLDTL